MRRGAAIIVAPGLMWGTSAIADPVHLSAEPYLWAPTIAGTVSLGPLTVPVDVGPDQLASGVRAGIMGYAALEKGRSYVATEVIAVDFNHKRFAPLLGQDIAATVLSIEAEAGYRFVATSRLRIAPFVGVRYNYLKADAGTAPANIRVTGEWIEPIVGFTADASLARRLDARIKLNHGIGSATQYSFDVRGDVDYRLGRRFSVFAGYRHSDHFYRGGATTPFVLDLRGNGPLIGLRGRF